MATIYHIREKQLVKRGGSQFYLDRSIRPAATLCGTSITAYDVAFADKAPRFAQFRTGELFEPCTACVELREK